MKNGRSSQLGDKLKEMALSDNAEVTKELTELMTLRRCTSDRGHRREQCAER